MIRITFAVFVLFQSHIAYAQNVHYDTAGVRLITADIDAFWKAFDTFRRDTTQNPFEAYLRDGTPALRDFFDYLDFPAIEIRKRVRRDMDRYEEIRSNTYAMHQYETAIKTYFVAFKEIYPKAVFPDVHFVIGFFNRGATVSKHGIIIGMETFAGNPVAGKDAEGPELIPRVAAGCLIFFHQKPAHTGHTVLRQSIIQGSSEFLATLFLSEEDNARIMEQPNFTYGPQYEETLVREFLRDKDSNEFDRWLYHPPSPDGRPAGLGAWIGFRITEAYYHSIADKVKAIDDILMINDFERFLVVSGYAEPFRN